jgi:hypothetical protein
MSRTQKQKFETYLDVSLQVMPETSTEDKVVTAAESSNFESTKEKRKREADKSLYLKRV